MATPNYSIAPVAREDLSVLAHFLHSSKQALSVNRLIFLQWPNDKLQMQMYTGAVTTGFESSDMHDFKAVDNETGEIIGYIVFKQTAAKTDDEIEARNKKIAESEKTIPEGINPPLMSDVNNAVLEISKPADKIDHVELVYMCVRPEFQRRGIGSKLLNLAIDHAKAAKIPFYVHSEAPAFGFFEKLGLKETSYADIDLRKYAAPNCGFGPFRLSGMILNP